MAQYKRKHQKRTDYRARLKLVSSGKNRLIIRRSNKNFLLQIAQFKDGGDKILLSATSKELTTLGWKGSTSNIPSAYLTGLLMAKKSKEKKLQEVVLDLGLAKAHTGGNLFAALKGCVDGGMNIPHGKEVFPKEDRIKGSHTKDKGAQFETVKKNILAK